MSLSDGKKKPFKVNNLYKFTLSKISNLEPAQKIFGLYSVLSRCWIEHEQVRKELWWMDWMIFSSKLKLNLNIQQTREIFLHVKVTPLFPIDCLTIQLNTLLSFSFIPGKLLKCLSNVIIIITN